MPELPEVETLRRSLEQRLIGRAIVDVHLSRRDIVTTQDDPAGGRSRDGRGKGPRPRRVRKPELLVGTTIRRLERHGKQLALFGATSDRCSRQEERVLLVHLGMTGQLRYLDVGMRLHNAKHVHATWWLEPEGRLIFRDPRRFGGLWTLRSVQDLEARWADLGPDALSVTAPVLKRQLGDSTRSIKSALLDQSILSGVGNIYADEALFLAGVHPARVAGDLSNKELGRLSHALREVLETSIASGGSTLKDYADGDGIPGRAQEKHLVYGRAGKNCTTCGTSLCKGVLAQRTTVWCPRCQPTKDLSV